MIGQRDRALLGLMVYTFARVGAAINMRVEDAYVQGRRTWVRLQEKGGKQHEMLCHHNLEAWLHAYVDGAQLADGKGWLFRSAAGRGGKLTERAMAPADVFRMIGRRTLAAGIQTHIGCHSFRATGITEYLRNGGKLEIAQQMANHERARTTSLYDRRGEPSQPRRGRANRDLSRGAFEPLANLNARPKRNPVAGTHRAVSDTGRNSKPANSPAPDRTDIDGKNTEAIAPN